MSRALSLCRGLAIGVLAGVLVFAMALLVGVVPTGSRVVFVVGGVAAISFALISRGEMRLEIAGAVMVGLGAGISGIVSEWGWLEYSGVVGSGVAIIWLLTGEQLPRHQWQWFRWGGVVLPFLILLLLPLVMDGGTLGHDEAAYGVKAKSWLEGTPDTGWSLHRATGMSVYGFVILAAGGSEAGLRMLGMVAVLALVSGVWSLANLMANPRVAAVAAIGIVAGPSMLRRSTEYLSDVPAAALLVFCMVVVWREFSQRELPTYRLLWVLPLAWAAFYLRYQSILSIALIALVIAMLWWRKVRQRPGPVVSLMAVGLLGFIPHAIHAIDATGSPIGIVTHTSGGVIRAYVGQGLVDYANQLDWSLAGLVGPVALLAAIAGMAASWRKSEMRKRYLFLLVPASLQVIALGLLSHGEPRFIFFPLALTVVAGAIAVDVWVSRGASRIAVPVALGLAVLLVGSLALSAGMVRRSVENRARVNLLVESAAIELRSNAGESTCGVLTSYAPQVTFYSECASDIFYDSLDPEAAVDRLVGETKFMVLLENGKRQPEGDELSGLVSLTSGAPFLVQHEGREALIYGFAD